MKNVGRYTILEPIWEQGYLGPLFRARDEQSGRTVALRIVRDEIASNPRRRAALLADASAAMKVSHPHVAALYDVGEADNLLYLAHEYVPGKPLEVLLAGRTMEQQVVVEIALHVADALAEAERCGLVHRDVYTASVIVTPKDQAKLTDLGFASWTSSGALRRRVVSELSSGQEWWEDRFPGALNRPPSYMAPEEVLGQRADPRSDIFSLGVVLFQMVTGQVPFAGASDAGTAMKIVQATQPPASRINPSIPPQLDALISRMLVKNIDGRYQHAGEVAADLRQLASVLHVHALAQRQQGKVTPAQPSAGRSRRTTLAVAVIALLMMVALAWWLNGSGPGL